VQTGDATKADRDARDLAGRAGERADLAEEAPHRPRALTDLLGTRCTLHSIDRLTSIFDRDGEERPILDRFRLVLCLLRRKHRTAHDDGTLGVFVDEFPFHSAWPLDLPEFREVFLKKDLLQLEMNDPEQDRFIAAFDDRAAFMAHLAATQKRSGKVVRSARFGFKERSFGGGLKADSDAADVCFGRFQRSKLLFIAALDTGLRENDLRLLKRSSVDLTRGVVSVITEKTGKPAVVALSDRCRDAIVAATSQRSRRANMSSRPKRGGRTASQPSSATSTLARQLAGITRRCRLNGLRHTFASNLASYGCNLLIIRDALGHTTTRMSERYAKP